MTAQTLILLVSIACLLAVLVLNWGRPRKRQSAGTLTIDLECIAKQQEGVSQVMRLEVKDAGRGANVNPAPTYARPPAPPSPPKAPRTAKRRSR